ncbi:MAG TPA: AlkA N-terminal domain-containing protein [Atribacterota bacterium]|nr:AlkA N-terminal domain-containing protein [Atribacterota bacterium]
MIFKNKKDIYQCRNEENLDLNSKNSDGKIFIGISSTGIYCRPICHARQPKAENRNYFNTAAEAEKAGFRPCLLCRPELAPKIISLNSATSLASQIARYIEENCGNAITEKDLAQYFNCTEQYLEQQFKENYNVTTSEYLKTYRLLLAKQLLTDTNLSSDEIAKAVGFNNSQNLNKIFKEQYRLEPERLRRKKTQNKEKSDYITLSLAYRAPYRWETLLDFLALRAIPGVEMVKDEEYFRTVHMLNKHGEPVYGWLKVSNRPEKNSLSISISNNLVSVIPKVLSRVRHLFDLSSDPDEVQGKLSSMNQIQPDLFSPGIRIPGAFNAFEMVVRAVLGQQITVKAARTLVDRFAQTFGILLNIGVEGLTHTFPVPDTILSLGDNVADYLGPIGITSRRAKTILELARAFKYKTIELNFPTKPEKEIEKLKEIPGIGEWTAQYIAMRAMRWPDAFPHTDYGIKKALSPRTDKEILELAESWRPCRSYAAINLWNSL